MKPIKKTKKGEMVGKAWIAKNTKFKPEYCQTLINYGKKGKSIAQFCASLEICRSTFDCWIIVHDDFGHAKRISVEACRAYWDDKVELYAIESPEGEKLNAQHLRYIASERFPMRQPIKLRDVGNVASCFEDVALAASQGNMSVEDANKYGQLFSGLAMAQQHETMWKDIEELKRIVAQNNSERFGESEGSIEEGDLT
jgi:hypothetical protein